MQHFGRCNGIEVFVLYENIKSFFVTFALVSVAALMTSKRALENEFLDPWFLFRSPSGTEDGWEAIVIGHLTYCQPRRLMSWFIGFQDSKKHSFGVY